jgi:hypothetical protein
MNLFLPQRQGGNAVFGAQLYAAAQADATPPVLTGAITASGISTAGFTISWPAATDNVGVTGYEYSVDGGSSWNDAGNVLTKAIAGLSASTAYGVRVRAYDAAGNKSTPALAATITTAAISIPPVLSAGNSAKVKDILFRVCTQLQDISPQFRSWTERELVDWLNDGQKAIAKYIPFACSRVDAVKLNPGTRQSIDMIDADNLLPGDGTTAITVYGNFLNDVVRNMGTDGMTPGRVIQVVSREMLDYSNPDWHTAPATGRVDEYTFDIRTPKVFYVSPPVGTTPVWVEISFMADPDVIPNTGTPQAPLYGMDGDSEAAITIDDKYIDDLVNYVLARAQFKDADYAMAPGSAASYMQLFVSSINSQVQAITGNNPNLKTLPFTPQLPAAAS